MAGSSPEEQPPTTIRQVREARETEHSQGAPRTATVADDVKSLSCFSGRVKGTGWAVKKQGCTQAPAAHCALCPPPRKTAYKRDLTKGSVSPFSGSSFSKEEPQGVGARSPHTVPRSGPAREQSLRLPFGQPPPFTQGRLWGAYVLRSIIVSMR